GLGGGGARAGGARVAAPDPGGAPQSVPPPPPGSGTPVPPADARALADAIARLLPATTSAAARKERPARQPPADTGRFAEIFREAAADGHGARDGGGSLNRTDPGVPP